LPRSREYARADAELTRLAIVKSEPTVQRFLNEATQHIAIKGLGEYSQICGDRHRCVAVTDREHHRQAGVSRADFIRKAYAVYRPGHNNVAEYQVDLRTVGQKF
jgi:hypothetical protein